MEDKKKDQTRNIIMFIVIIILLIGICCMTVYIAKSTNSLRYSVNNMVIETDETYSNETLNDSVQMIPPLTTKEPIRVYRELKILMI